MSTTRAYRIIAIVSAIAFALLLLFNGLRSARLRQDQITRIEKELGQKQPVLVAKEILPAGTILTQDIIEQKIQKRDYLVSSLPSNTLETIDELDGKVLIVPVYANEPLISDRLRHPDAVPSLSYILPEGRFAFALPTSQDRAVGGEVRRGDRVDIITMGEARDAEAVVLLSNVLVLGRPGDFLHAAAASGQGTGALGAGFGGVADMNFPTTGAGGNILILDLAAGDCLELTMALNTERVFVALRSQKG